jgi:hypothetical protein
MVILFDGGRPVKPVRPFGAGILPPESSPVPRSPFEPTPADRAWWAAESARLGSRPPRPAWTFDRAGRLRDVIDRARSLETYLLRERCDAAHRPVRVAALNARLVVVAARVRRLCAAARAERRAAYRLELENRANEAAALDALERGLWPADPVRFTDQDLARVEAVG